MTVVLVRRITWSGFSAAVAAAGLTLLVVVPVAAECDGPIPPFRDYADTAKRIVIGTVTWIEPKTGDSVGRSTHFMLRVTDVLRGPVVRTLEVRDMAFLDCSDHFIRAAEGERIALAIDAHGFEPPRTFATMAWIRAASEVEPDYRITQAEVIALVGRAPDTDATPAGSLPGTGTVPWPPLALAALVGVVAWLARPRAGPARLGAVSAPRAPASGGRRRRS